MIDDLKLNIEGFVQIHLLPVGEEPGLLLPEYLAWEGKNVYTRLGYQKIASWLASYTGVITPPKYIAAGSGVGTPATTDTSMTLELGRVGLSSYSVLSSYTARLLGVFGPAQANATWTEIGLYDTLGYPTTAIPASATGYTTTTLTDSGATWTVNEWAGCRLHIVSAITSGAPQSATIVSNTATVLTFGAITLPVGNITYTIGKPTLFAHAAVSVAKTASNTANVSWSLTQQYV